MVSLKWNHTAHLRSFWRMKFYRDFHQSTTHGDLSNCFINYYLKVYEDDRDKDTVYDETFPPKEYRLYMYFTRQTRTAAKLWKYEETKSKEFAPMKPQKRSFFNFMQMFDTLYNQKNFKEYVFDEDRYFLYSYTMTLFEQSLPESIQSILNNKKNWCIPGINQADTDKWLEYVVYLSTVINSSNAFEKDSHLRVLMIYELIKIHELAALNGINREPEDIVSICIHLAQILGDGVESQKLEEKAVNILLDTPVNQRSRYFNLGCVYSV
eukprot:TRINITY_DN1546_c0_g1_i3.p1 TRINITY_DN1546_c0_g1~~TRINITY_DN1546_c0_g1_i3.p1  ORF type:complete len:267 (-),score=20.31 TRINITY_DN1546_c0_g1_i3:391-1191(-)